MILLIYFLLCYGISNIIIFGSIFTWLRNLTVKLFGEGDYSLSHLVTCFMCLPFWLGVFMTYWFTFQVNLSTNFLPSDFIGLTYSSSIKNLIVLFMFNGSITSGGCWLIHTLQERLEK